MRVETREPILALDAGQVLTIEDAAGRRISARSGAVWITEEGDPKDHIVESGSSRIVVHGGRTVVQALAPSVVAIQ